MFKCKTCQKLEEENKYLRTLVDRLLVRVGTSPVDLNPAIGAEIGRKILEEEDTSGHQVETFGG